MKKTTITIIIPVFNVENVVSETLLSVKNQSVPADEVIIVNDGSTDNSFDKINNFNDLKGWKILQTENQGLGLTRNFGKSFAKSEYIYFLDSDDIIKDDFIEKIHKIILKNDKPDMILFSGETFGDTYKQNKVNLKFSVHGKFYQNDKLITKLVKKNETLPQVSRYITKLNLWSKNVNSRLRLKKRPLYHPKKRYHLHLLLEDRLPTRHPYRHHQVQHPLPQRRSQLLCALTGPHHQLVSNEI